MRNKSLCLVSIIVSRDIAVDLAQINTVVVGVLVTGLLGRDRAGGQEVSELVSAETAEGCRDDEEGEEEDRGQTHHHHLGLKPGATAQARDSQTAESETSESCGRRTSRPVHLDLQQPGQLTAAVQGDVGEVQVGQPLPGDALRLH